jgi:hypothetical protein
MKKLILSVLFTSSILFSFGQVDQAYRNKVKLLMQYSGGKDAYDAAILQMFTMFSQQYPNVPEQFWAEFKEEFIKISTDELVVLFAPVYARHLTSKELDDIIAFYQTAAGKKLASSQGAITAESMSVGQDWGAILGEKVLKKLKEKGY